MLFKKSFIFFTLSFSTLSFSFSLSLSLSPSLSLSISLSVTRSVSLCVPLIFLHSYFHLVPSACYCIIQANTWFKSPLASFFTVVFAKTSFHDEDLSLSFNSSPTSSGTLHIVIRFSQSTAAALFILQSIMEYISILEVYVQFTYSYTKSVSKIRPCELIISE
ncbi:unnamed protein product [Acanthosepion pharaonis]|uniref:Uncharacterized protein n=1 Tax=Acanthosepion pharaonis TaxID=158019 RepID=A0A812C648_ACAPH|nr:unnamed protein product [Sepia pharaonis]